MVERVFEFDTVPAKDKQYLSDFGDAIGVWLWRETAEGKAYRVTVRVEPVERVKWPKFADGVHKMKIGIALGHGGRGAFLLSGGASIGAFGRDELGTWPHNESRIAENDNGFVKLSEVPDAK